VASLLGEYLKVNNKAYKEGIESGFVKGQELVHLGFCSLIPIIRNLRVINDSFCKESNDFISFVLAELRSQEVEHRRSGKQMDYLKLAYSEIFKHRFQAEYDRTLRSLTGHPSESVKYSSITRSAIAPITWESFRTHISNSLQNSYYISEFMIL
jgi:hypothetical protein